MYCLVRITLVVSQDGWIEGRMTSRCMQTYRANDIGRDRDRHVLASKYTFYEAVYGMYTTCEQRIIHLTGSNSRATIRRKLQAYHGNELVMLMSNTAASTVVPLVVDVCKWRYRNVDVGLQVTKEVSLRRRVVG